MKFSKNLFVLYLSLLVTPVLGADYKLETIADDLEMPWSLTFLPDGNFLVSYLDGEIRKITAAGEESAPLNNTPKTYRKSQGGYFDVVLDPNFDSNQTIYLAFAHGTPEANGVRIAKAVLKNEELENVTPIFTVKDRKDTPMHYGGKLLFANDGTLLLTTGDGFDYREAAQDPFNQMGKILRMNKDGSVPANNPFANGANGDPFVYSSGHRNPQGLALDGKTGTVYMHEHGPQGGDEVNQIVAGANYGWPVTSYGVNYTGAKVTPFETLDGIAAPLKYWTPSIAPSGMTFYTGTSFPAWQGSLLVGALVDKDVKRLTVVDGKIADEETLFAEIGQRIRDVRTAPDGMIYLLAENTGDKAGKLIRVTPKQ